MPSVTKSDIAAVVVLYRPDASVRDNIAAIAPQVGRVIVVDNTEDPDPLFIGGLTSAIDVEYVPLGANTGIAAALNVGVRRSREAGFGWAITLDQDSTPGGAMVQALSECATYCTSSPRIGIISPMQADEGGPELPAYFACRTALTVITSGDLLSIDAWSEVGGFDEGLFIDQVDHDFCLRLHSHGFGVVRCGAATMTHRVGQLEEHSFPRRAYTTGHSPLRRYYIARNRFIVSKRYGKDFPEFRRREMKALRRELAKIVLYEDRKCAKLIMSWRGYRDFRRGVTGAYVGSSR